jgi:hypothetical protein
MTMDRELRLTAAIRIAERDVAGRHIETVIVLDAQGHVLYMATGERDRVSAPVAMLRGSIVIHNHPDGGSLSRQDVRLMLDHGIVQMRAVTDAAVFVLDLPDDTVWEDVEELVAFLTDNVRASHRDLILDGKMTYEESEQRRWHEIWTGVAEIRGWAYRMEPRQAT